MIGVVVAAGTRGTATGGDAVPHVVDQLERLGVRVDPVVGGTGEGLPDGLGDVAERLGSAGEAVVLLPDDLRLHDVALGDLLEDPRPLTRVLVGRAGGAVDGAGVRLRGGRVVAAASAVHAVAAPDGAFTGALVVGVQDLQVAAEAVREMAAVARTAGWEGDPLPFVLVALVRRQVSVTPVRVDPWPWARLRDSEAGRFQQGLDGLDAHRVRLSRATRPDDGFFATFVIRKLSRRLTPLALRLRLSPNQITGVSLVIGLAAAGCFALGDRAALVAGALLLQLSLVVDCVDGEVARYTRAFSSLGAWLDATTDRVKEFACYAGLAVGAGPGDLDVWLLAAAMLTLQTTRHSTDYTFTLVKDVRESRLEALPLDQTGDHEATTGSGAASRRMVSASERSNERASVRWVKRVVHMPIGERWLVISAGAAFGTPRLVFLLLLSLGLLALAYTTSGRTLRARTWPARRSTDREREVVVAQLDGGPLAGVVGRVVGPLPELSGRYLWVLPPALRLGEYGFVLLVTWLVAPSATPAAFALLFALAYHHYDELYRVLNRLPPPAAVRLFGLGVEGRMLVVGVLTIFGGDVLETGLWVLAALFGLLFLGVGTVAALREVRPTGRTVVPTGVVRA